MRDGDRPAAIRWLERAHRLVPADGNIALSLAAACLGVDDARAAVLFRLVLTRNDAREAWWHDTREAWWHDTREAWWGLAGALLRLGQPAEAAEALANGLQRHAPSPDIRALADAIRATGAAPGWCGLDGSGQVIAPTESVIARLDGRRIGVKIPVRAWATGRHLTVTVGGRPLLGSPIDIQAISRVEGCAEPWEGGITGWAWHPHDPDTHPVLTIRDAGGRLVCRITATDETVTSAGDTVLARPRGFHVPASRLAGRTAPFHVLGRDGRDVLGSPLDPSFAPLILPVAGPVPTGPPTAATDIVVPVHGQTAVVLACLDSVLASVGAGDRVIVVDDASPEPDLAELLDRMAREGRILLVRHPRPLGFPASANAGIAAGAGNDVVLLNSDTLVPPGWLGRLRAAASQAPDIGTVTPLSNNATILTYPAPGRGGPMPDLPATIRLDRLAQRANGLATVEIPVGVGFCLYLKRACLDATGLMRAEVFAQGYGEETDFCLRAHAGGWRHVAAPGVFVAHRGGASFGAASRHLRARNDRLLARLHPDYDRLLRAFLDRDPLAEARRRLDRERWRAASDRQAPAIILISHADGGGVEQRVMASAAHHRAAGVRPIVLRPALSPDGQGAVVVGDFPNLRYALPAEAPALLRLLRASRLVGIEVHHFLDHPPAIHDLVRRLGLPYDVHIHDYAWICPRISLVDGDRHYCGEPDEPGCERCIAQHGRLVREEIGVPALRRRSAAFLAAARRVIAPSRDAATRLRRYFPDLGIAVVPHTDDAVLPPRVRPGNSRVCVAGAIGPHKGFDILLACARDAAARGLALEFVVVGDTTDDTALLATGHAFITGTYDPAEAVALIRGQAASLGFLPSIWPETWSLTLTELWRAGLAVAAFDLGAPAERIRATGGGFLLPLGLPPAAINNALLAAIGRSGHV